MLNDYDHKKNRPRVGYLDQGLANLSVRGQRVNILGFVVSVTRTQLCHFSVKAAREKYVKE